MQDRINQVDENLLHRTAGPYSWVKMRRTHIVHMSSALPPIATEERTFLMGRFVPKAAISRGSIDHPVGAGMGVDCHTTICQPFAPLTHTLV